MRGFIDRSHIKRAQRCRGGEDHDQPIGNTTDEIRRIGLNASSEKGGGNADSIAETIQADDAQQPFRQMSGAPGCAKTNQQEDQHGQNIRKNGKDAFAERGDWSE